MGNPTTIALTATATPEVQQDIVRQLGLTPDDIQLFHEGIDRPNLDLKVLDVWDGEEKVIELMSVANYVEAMEHDETLNLMGL